MKSLVFDVATRTSLSRRSPLPLQSGTEPRHCPSFALFPPLLLTEYALSTTSLRRRALIPVVGSSVPRSNRTVSDTLIEGAVCRLQVFRCRLCQDSLVERHRATRTVGLESRQGVFGLVVVWGVRPWSSVVLADSEDRCGRNARSDSVSRSFGGLRSVRIKLPDRTVATVELLSNDGFSLSVLVGRSSDGRAVVRTHGSRSLSGCLHEQ